MPILYFDGNSRMGMVKSKWGVQKMDTKTCGDYNLGPENQNGEAIRKMCEKVGLVLVTTQNEIAPTYTSGAHHTPHHIDNIAMAYQLQNITKKANVYRRSAKNFS